MDTTQIQNKYLFYFGTVRGVLGHTECKSEKRPKFHFDKENKSSEITCMKWGRSDDEIIYGNQEGYIKSYNIALDKTHDIVQLNDGSGPVVGLGVRSDLLIFARKSGHIFLKNKKTTTQFRIDLDENKGTLECMEYNKCREGVIATGGEFNDFKIWDVETKTAVFKAKSLGHDELNLPIPTSVRGISFFKENEKLTSCATKEGYVLLYDERTQRRPVVKFVEPKASYTCIATTYRDERNCLVGTTRGYLQLIDLRTPTKCLKTFKSFTGSVTSIVCDPLEPIVATTSIDRYLRVHNLETKELLYKEYMKQSLTKILMKPVVKSENEEIKKGEVGDEDNTVDEEYESLFNNMQVIRDGEKDGIKKRKRVKNAKVVKVKKRSK